METISEKTEEDLIDLETELKTSELPEHERSLEVVSQITILFFDEVFNSFPIFSEDSKRKYIEQIKLFFVNQKEDSELNNYLVKGLRLLIREYGWKEKIGG